MTDTVGGPVDWVSPDGKKLGRNKRLKAERFWRSNHIRERMKSIEFDRYMTGDAYGVKGKLSPDQIKQAKMMLRKQSFLLSRQHSVRYKMKENDFADYLYLKAMGDEDIHGPKSFNYVASSTMEIISNETDVLGYVQRVAGKKKHFNVKEIIHLVLNSVDGKIHGFSPMETMSMEMYLIAMIKDNMAAFFENGGHPSKIYSLPDVKTIDDPSYERLVSLLRESKKVINSNGSLVYVGNLKVDDLGTTPKDLEYKDLAMWIVSNLAFAFQIPSTRIPFILSGSGGAVNKGDSGGVSDGGYWRMIETQQDYLEDVYNNQLFGDMGYHIRFVRGNKQDKIRDTQALVQQFDAVAKAQEIWKRYKKKPSEDKMLQMMDWSSDEIEDMEDEDLDLFEGTPMDRQNQMNDMQTKRNEVTNNRSDAKKVSADNKGISS